MERAPIGRINQRGRPDDALSFRPGHFIRCVGGVDSGEPGIGCVEPLD